MFRGLIQFLSIFLEIFIKTHVQIHILTVLAKKENTGKTNEKLIKIPIEERKEAGWKRQ